MQAATHRLFTSQTRSHAPNTPQELERRFTWNSCSYICKNAYGQTTLPGVRLFAWVCSTGPKMYKVYLRGVTIMLLSDMQ